MKLKLMTFCLFITLGFFASILPCICLKYGHKPENYQVNSIQFMYHSLSMKFNSWKMKGCNIRKLQFSLKNWRDLALRFTRVTHRRCRGIVWRHAVSDLTSYQNPLPDLDWLWKHITHIPHQKCFRLNKERVWLY